MIYSLHQRTIAQNHAEQIAALKTYVVEDNALPEQEDIYCSPYQDIFDMNPDMAGWLKIPDTRIDYPVMQTKEDEEYYLYRNFYKESDKNGCLVLAAAADIDEPSGNLLIYGHNMKSGEMFGDLDYYKDQTYAAEHADILLYTPDEERAYEIMAVFYAKVLYQEEEGFRYYQFFGADTEDAFLEFYDEVKTRSLYDTGVTAEFGDEFVTLSTCTNRGKRDRFVIVAKRTK